MSIAGRGRATLDRRVRREWVRARITFIGPVGKIYWNALLAARYDLIRKADRFVVPKGAEVGMESGRTPDNGYQICGIGIDGES